MTIEISGIAVKCEWMAATAISPSTREIMLYLAERWRALADDDDTFSRNPNCCQIRLCPHRANAGCAPLRSDCDQHQSPGQACDAPLPRPCSRRRQPKPRRTQIRPRDRHRHAQSSCRSRQRIRQRRAEPTHGRVSWSGRRYCIIPVRLREK